MSSPPINRTNEKSEFSMSLSAVKKCKKCMPVPGQGWDQYPSPEPNFHLNLMSFWVSACSFNSIRRKYTPGARRRILVSPRVTERGTDV